MKFLLFPNFRTVAYFLLRIAGWTNSSVCGLFGRDSLTWLLCTTLFRKSTLSSSSRVCSVITPSLMHLSVVSLQCYVDHDYGKWRVYMNQEQVSAFFKLAVFSIFPGPMTVGILFVQELLRMMAACWLCSNISFLERGRLITLSACITDCPCF